MNRDEKAAVVEEIAGQIQAAEAVFAVDYRGLTVPQAAELRTKLRDADASFRIVKNSLTERAADRAGAESLKAMLVGPTALTLVRGDAALAAKTLSDTARALTAQDVTAIARLPSRDILNAQLVGTIAAPLVGLVRGLNGLLSGVAIQLQQVLEQRVLADPAAAAALAEAAAAVAEPVAEVAVEPEAEAVAEAEPVAEPEPAAEPEPEAAAEPEAVAEPEPAPEPEPEAAAEPEPEAAAEPEPAATPSTTTTEEPDQDSASEDASDV
jgi:large subunit ribosomal protein L10